MFVCLDLSFGVYFKSISLVGSGDRISVSNVVVSCVCWLWMVVSGVLACSIFDRSTSTLSVCVGLLGGVGSSCVGCVVVSCFALLCSCVTYCKSLGLI